MQLNGYRAFLMGTATDLPTRGFYLKFQRRDAVESRSRANGLLRDAAVSGNEDLTWNGVSKTC
jgi:hypothetical protein